MNERVPLIQQGQRRGAPWEERGREGLKMRRRCWQVCCVRDRDAGGG